MVGVCLCHQLTARQLEGFSSGLGPLASQCGLDEQIQGLRIAEKVRQAMVSGCFEKACGILDVLTIRQNLEHLRRGQRIQA